MAMSLVACSGISLERKSEIQFTPLFVGQVKEVKEIQLDAFASKSEHVMAGFLLAGIPGLILTMDTEDDYGSPKGYEYIMNTAGTERSAKVVSYSYAKAGSCVEVISPDDSKVELLRKLPEERCSSL